MVFRLAITPINGVITQRLCPPRFWFRRGADLSNHSGYAISRSPDDAIQRPPQSQPSVNHAAFRESINPLSCPPFQVAGARIRGSIQGHNTALAAVAARGVLPLPAGA